MEANGNDEGKRFHLHLARASNIPSFYALLRSMVEGRQEYPLVYTFIAK